MRTSIAVTAAALVLALAACGDDSESGSPAAPGDVENPTTVTVSVVPSIDSASLYLADQQGFFEEEGLAVEFEQAGSGPAAVSSVVSNATQFGLAANLALLQARSNNIPLVAVAPAAGTGSDPEQSKDQVVVPADSDISSFADLTGRTVAVVAVKNSPELFIRSLIDADGGDSTATNFVEVPFPEMGTALQAGRVDAIGVNEPFLTRALDAGGTPIGSYIDEPLGADSAYTWWFTSEQYASESPEVVEGFQRAMAKAGEYANENPDEVRAVVIERLSIDPALAEQINLPSFANEPDPTTFETVMELMVEYEFIAEPVETDGLVFTAN